METQYDSLYSTLSKIETKKGVGKLLREFESAMQRMDDLVDLEIKKDPQSEKIPYFLKIKSLIGQEVDAQYNKDGSKHEGLFCISADERGEFKGTVDLFSINLFFELWVSYLCSKNQFFLLFI